MEYEILDWAYIKCSKPAAQSDSENAKTIFTENCYGIAIDVTDLGPQNFTCPFCGEEMALEIDVSGWISPGEAKKIVREKRRESRESLAAFVAVSVFVIVAALARAFTQDSFSRALELIVPITAGAVWLPFLLFMIHKARIVSSESGIIEDYRKKRGETVSTSLYPLRGQCPSRHMVEAMPKMKVAETEEAYGLKEAVGRRVIL